ncbi:MAG: hypothetical protein E6J88_09390 [Deltaproteobacteria bacterium]|nr:MAG: hypothetical protein E6J88_09390 [Deltaproteobacteria bacterium]
MIAIILAVGLGSAELHSSCAPAAQKEILRGELLLHSFMYETSREAFQAAQKKDPHCAIAWWGEAMTWDHPLWGEADLPAGRKALAAMPQSDRLTPLEKGLIEAAQADYSSDDDDVRHAAWTERLARLHADLPKDDEAQLFYALSLYAQSHGGRDVKLAMEAGALALDVFARKPDHPGAAHYVIHSFDSPDHAILALPAARRYAQIAPEAGHALHMPSHIFIQLGMWKESEASNIASFAASEKEWARRGKREHWRDWHSTLWLVSSRLELGRAADAEAELTRMRLSMEKDNHPSTRWSYAYSVSMYLHGTQQWSRTEELLAPLARLTAAEDEPVDEAVHCPTDVPDRMPSELLTRMYAARIRLAAAAFEGDEAKARAQADVLEGLVARAAKVSKMATPEFRGRIKLMTGARIAQAAARKDAAQLTAAIDATCALAESEEKTPQLGPLMERFARVDLGDLLLRSGKPADAAAAYRAALARRANQSAALRGLTEAARPTGDVAARE